MIKCTLDTYRIYMRRKEELEGMKNNFKRRHSKEEWHKFDENLNEIKHYLAGNLCRCTGYMSQLRAIKNFLEAKKED